MAESHPISLLSLYGREGSSFPGSVPPNDVVNSVSMVGIKPGDSGVVIGCQVDKFTYTSLAECFIFQSHIYPGLTAKMSTLIHFPLHLDC